MLISPAWAQEAAGAAAEAPGFIISMLPLIAIFFIFYVMVIRPQNKRIVEHRNMINSLQRGDKVITGGGLLATVKKMQGDDEVILEIADGVEVTAMRHTIMTVRDAKKAEAKK